LIVASPVGSPELSHALRGIKAVDKVKILEQPPFFHAFSQTYVHWRDIPDHEVIKMLNQKKQILSDK